MWCEETICFEYAYYTKKDGKLIHVSIPYIEGVKINDEPIDCSPIPSLEKGCYELISDYGKRKISSGETILLELISTYPPEPLTYEIHLRYEVNFTCPLNHCLIYVFQIP
jgi:hypothetical protein